jgi:hypothetical protein
MTMPGMAEAEIFLVRVGNGQHWDLSDFRQRFHSALLSASEANPNTVFPITIERWQNGTAYEFVDADGEDIQNGWARMLDSLDDNERESFNESFRIVYSVIDLKRSVFGRGPLDQRLAHIRSILGTFTQAVVDVGLSVYTVENGCAVYPTMDYINSIRQECRSMTLYPMFGSNVCLGFVALGGNSWIRYKCYDVRSSVAVKNNSGSVFQAASFQPAELSGGVLSIVERYLRNQSQEQGRKVRDYQAKCRLALIRGLSVLGEFLGQRNLKCPCRHEWSHIPPGCG